MPDAIDAAAHLQDRQIRVEVQVGVAQGELTSSRITCVTG
jgi:hypothetical protein